jgi:hypothetical protein
VISKVYVRKSLQIKRLQKSIYGRLSGSRHIPAICFVLGTELPAQRGFLISTTNRATPSVTVKAITMATKFACPKTIQSPIHPVMKPRNIGFCTYRKEPTTTSFFGGIIGAGVPCPVYPKCHNAAERYCEFEDRGLSDNPAPEGDTRPFNTEMQPGGWKPKPESEERCAHCQRSDSGSQLLSYSMCCLVPGGEEGVIRFTLSIEILSITARAAERRLCDDAKGSL